MEFVCAIITTECILIKCLVLLGLIRVVGIGAAWSRGRSIRRINGSSRHAATAAAAGLLALHLELLGFSLALLGSFEFFVL